MQTKRKVLVVDDHPSNIAIAEEILSEDFSVRSVPDGEKALEILEWYRPDVILLDINMPGIDGYEVCRRIREHEDLRFTKVMMVSAKSMTTERLAGYDAGADDYLTKPYSEEELLSKVRVYGRLKAAEEVEQLKGELIGLLAGETGNPLDGLLGPAGILGSEERVNGDVRTRLGNLIFQRARQLRLSIEQVLSLCSLRSGTRQLRFEPVLLADLVESAISSATPRAASKQVLLEASLNTPITVVADREHLQKAVVDILENAIERSPCRRSVRVVLEAEDGEGRIVVSDKGRRVRGERIRGLFRVLPEVDDPEEAPAEERERSGLGLALAREIVLLHGGTIEVDSRLLRTVFAVTLPVRGEGKSSDG